MSEAEQPAQPGKSMMGFKSARASKPKLPKDEARRQGNIATLAFLLLGGRDRAMAFLNTADETLGARPIDLAIASDAGYSRVEAAIKRIANPALREMPGGL
jgi:uncharacterized protein (DUF2384 family)